MAKGKPKTPGNKKPIEPCAHKDIKRSNNPAPNAGHDHVLTFSERLIAEAKAQAVEKERSAWSAVT